MYTIRISVPIGKKPNGELQEIDTILAFRGMRRVGDPRPDRSYAGYVDVTVQGLTPEDVSALRKATHVLYVMRAQGS